MKKMYILFLCLFFTSTSFCQDDTTKIIIDPELHIAKEINERRIVMIGESPHNHPSGYKEIIKILNEWIKQDCNTNKDTIKLNLILEIDSLAVNLISLYIETGDLSKFFDACLPFGNFETFEFYSDLKKLYDLIEEQNSNIHNGKKKFEIKGFEEVGANIPPEFMKKSRYDTEYWFIKERDSVSSYRIIDYVNKHKDEKYLIFYGNAHLIKGLVEKNFGFIISEDSCMGHYMADYLKKEFGDTNVITINQIMLSKRLYIEIGHESLKGKNFYLKNKDAKWIWLRPSSYDFLLFKPYLSLPNHIFNLVYSKRVFEKSIDRIKIFRKYYPNDRALENIYSILGYLFFLTGKKVNDVNELEDWLKMNQSFDLSYFDTKEFKESIFKMYSSDAKNENLKSILIQLGFDESIYNYNSLDTLNWNIKIWPDAIKNIKFLNAIGIYWIGYPEEKVEAKKFLKEFTGEDYNEPAKYLQWWRNVYHDYGI